uniref:EF-hand domain-containing protein n=1 Tax=Cannabis sativa TaxID=3483 RepID=A0A803NZE8_CANSA
MACQNGGVMFEDFFPAMVDKLGAEGFMKELCNGFRLLMDSRKGVITFESLKRSSAFLGLQGLSDEELMLSPALMQSSDELLEEALISGI